jgi:hypothetical protein
MHDTVRSADSLHTNVCRTEQHLLGSYRALIAHEIEKQRLTLTALAEKTGYNRRSLKRMITGKQELRCRDIITICAAIGIDRQSASYAIETMGSWEYYYEVSLGIVLSLSKPILSKIIDQATAAMEPLSPAALEQLSDWIAETVIRNQKQIYDRRDRLTDLPRL